MTDCIFCKIATGDIPSYKIYEDDVVYAFLDLSQATKGHTLVIPKKHTTDIFDYDEQLAADVFSRIPKIAKAIEKAFPDLKGLNIINNNREFAYQSVFHSHFHLIPRYDKQDGFSMSFVDNQKKYTPEAMEQIAVEIRKQVD